MTDRKKYSLKDLLKQCDPDAPMPQAVQDWDKMELVGREKFEDSPFQGEVSEWPTKRTKQ